MYTIHQEPNANELDLTLKQPKTTSGFLVICKILLESKNAEIEVTYVTDNDSGLEPALALADCDDRVASLMNYDTNTSEAQPLIGFVVHNEARYSPFMIDDSSSSSSTNSLPSVVY
ncbi:hypothetical protein Tco_1415825 [Tanacetum coccineum]